MSAVAAQETAGEAPQAAPVPGLSLDAIIDYIDSGDISHARASLERQIELNAAISAEGLENPWGAEVGRTLLATRGDDIACRARARAAAGSDARMSGCALPVAIVSPSRSTTPTWCAARATASRRTVCAPPRAPGGTGRMRARERARS